METKTGVPRRWTVEIDGIRWLPRMIDKARMRERGELGSYLLGHSPVDRAFLARAGVSTEEFATVAGAESDDAAVLAALRARSGWDEERMRRWSERFPVTYRRFISLWDLDEGYRRPNLLERIGMAAFRPVEGFVMGVFRRIKPAP
ncbi:MAG TPA: DUF5069 domain-containing protein [Candidatus Elarobacter sp.]|nr:DUF5069 domain-containing protein [Candidatus Elarobacter sp.]